MDFFLNRTINHLPINWDRLPQSHQEEEWCAQATHDVVAFLGSMKSITDQLTGKWDIRARRLIQPLVLNLWDSFLVKRSGVTISEEAIKAGYEHAGADSGFIGRIIHALEFTRYLAQPQSYTGDGDENGYLISSGAVLSEIFSDKAKAEALDHSQPLDVHRWSEHSEVNAFVDEVYRQHFEGGNTSIRKRHLKVVLLDLYVRWALDPSLKTGVSRNVDDYMKKKSRYNELHITKLTPEIVDILAEAGLTYGAMGFQGTAGKRGKVSRIWPTPRLMKMFRHAQFGPQDIGDAPDRETIILRKGDPADKGKKIEIAYEDTAETNRMREVLKAYNDLLRSTFIDIPALETPHIELPSDSSSKPKRLHVTQTDKFVRRIFNRGSFEKGGRFFGGWWQRCPKEWRGSIFLDDKPTSELDYSGLHIVLLYALAGIDYWRDIDDDPYTIDFPEFAGSEAELRAVCKGLMLVALNARNETAAFQAFRDAAPTGSSEKRMRNGILRSLLNKLQEKHKPIADKFASDAGIDLMNIDSQITERIIDWFTYEEIPILTIHDSFIVPYDWQEQLRHRMGVAFAEVTGKANVLIKEEGHDPSGWEPMSEDDAAMVSPADWGEAMKWRFDPPRSRRYRQEYEQFKKQQAASV